MRYLKTFENFDNDIFAYHVTSRNNLESIMKNGLIPSIPEDYGDNGDIEGVYLFKTLDDTKNALYNWLGERIEEWEEENEDNYDEIVLKINIAGLESSIIDSVEFEWVCIETIEPSRIADILEI